MSTDNLINYATLQSSSIQDSVGNTYGSVSEIILDRTSGKVEFLVVGSGGILGIGKDYFVVPYKSVDINPNTGKIHINTTKEKIENAPHFDKDKVSKWSQEDRDEMLTYYGVSNLKHGTSQDDINKREGGLSDQNHDSYEGSSQVTNAQGPGNTIPGKNMDYDKVKGTNENSPH
ncbi:PRC-barrel domain-containing protein [Roseivirga sp. BDSF3-8]|uniref:PRC-barrel domain-containing protein n=1 Tax=Roseivirga sp. BDSF3-8 TaxID=3241598 RepID=UPI0035327E72